MNIYLKIGDVIFTGRFKNKKTTINSFGTDDKGQPLVNGKKALTFRVEKYMTSNQQPTNEKQEYMKNDQLKIKNILNESPNPELDNTVRKFIKNLAKKYGYRESDAIMATLQSIKRLNPRAYSLNDLMK